MRAVLALAALVLAAAGCRSAVEYRPSREVMRTIPREKAKEVLRECLLRAEPYCNIGVQGEVREVDVGDDAFTMVVAKEEEVAVATYTFPFRALDLRAYDYRELREGGHGWLLCFDGGVPGFAGPVFLNIESGRIWITSAADLELTIDALESLKEEAEAAAR